MNAADFLEMPADTATDSAESFLNSEEPAAAPKPAARNPPLKIQLDPYQQAYLNQVSQSNGTGQMLDPSRAGEGDFARALYHDLPADIGTRLDEAGNTAAAVVRANLDLLGGTIGGLTPSQSEEMAAQEIQADPLARKVLAKAGVNLPPTESPYEEARQSLPTVPRAVAGAGMGLIQSAPRLALAAVQPELGAASFGATPEGFDPVQAGVMLIAPAGGKIAGNILKKAADAAGVSSKTVLNAVDRAGGAASVAGLMSAPSVYQITQMPDGKEKQNAIENTAANAIIIGLLGATGHRGGENNEQIQATGKQAGTSQGGEQPGGAGGVYRGQEIRQGGNGQESGGIPNEPPSATSPAPRPPSAGEAHGAQPNVITGEQLNMPAGAIPPQVPTRNIPFKGIPDELLQEKPNKPVVPETPAEEYETAVQTVRRTQSKTIKQIQNLFPLAELSREQARVLRDQAWPQPESEQNASGIPSAKSIPQHEVRPPVGEATSLRQQGEVAGTRPPVETQGGVEPSGTPATPAQEPNGPKVKQPWEMTLPEFTDWWKSGGGDKLPAFQAHNDPRTRALPEKEFFNNERKSAIRWWMDQGKDIPASVLADYPNLKPSDPIKPPEQATAPVAPVASKAAEVVTPDFQKRAAQVEGQDHPELLAPVVSQIVQDEIKADPKGYQKEIDKENPPSNKIIPSEVSTTERGASQAPASSPAVVSSTAGKPFEVDESVIVHSPHTGEDFVASYRGKPSEGQAVIWTGKMQMQVPESWLRHEGEKLSIQPFENEKVANPKDKIYEQTKSDRVSTTGIKMSKQQLVDELSGPKPTYVSGLSQWTKLRVGLRALTKTELVKKVEQKRKFETEQKLQSELLPSVVNEVESTSTAAGSKWYSALREFAKKEGFEFSQEKSTPKKEQIAALSVQVARLRARKQLRELAQVEQAPTVQPQSPQPERISEPTASPVSPANETVTPKSTETQAKPTQATFEGMGGAVPSEFTQSATAATGIRNAVVDQERQARGLEPAMEPAKRAFGAVWDKVMSDFDKDPAGTYQRQQDLINELRKKPRALTDYEDAMLLHRQIELQNDYGKLTRELAQAFDDSKTFPNRLGDAEELKLRVARLSDELLDLYDINKTVGTETGRGLAARKMLAYENYTLANMEMRLRAAMGGKTLSPEQSAEVLRLNQKIDGLQKQIAEYEKMAATKSPGVGFNPYVIELAEKIVNSLDKAADAARTRIAERSKRLNAGIDPTMLSDYAIIGASHIGHIGLDFAKWADAMIKEFGEGIKPSLGSIYKESQKVAEQVADNMGAKKTPAVKKLLKSGGKLQAIKTRYANQIEKINQKMAQGDFTKPERTKIMLDEEGRKLKDAYERAKLEFDRMVVKEQLKNRTNIQKLQDTFVKWRRGFLLSSPVTLAKLTSAAIERIAFTPAEELVGTAFSKLPLVGQVSKMAPREGPISVRAEAKAIVNGWKNGMKDAASTLKTGHSQLESLFGKRNLMPFELVDFIGAIHGALKAPVKRSEFERSFQKRVEFAIRKGVDASDPLVQAEIAASAFKDAQRSIFMQDNRVTAAYNAAVAILKNKGTPGSRAAAVGMQVVFPIVKVPTNIIAETFQHATGLVTGSARLALAMKNGVEKLSPDEADLIMRSLKKGSLGAAFMLTGFLIPDAIGGYYQPNDRRSNHPKFGTIQLFGVNIPTYLIHNPLLETLQIGATLRHVADSKLRRNDRDKQGIAAGALSSALGLLEEVPFVKEPIEFERMFNPYERQKFMNEFARDLIVPLGVSWVAKYFDKDENGNYIQRDPETFWQELESALPYLRKNVPVKRH